MYAATLSLALVESEDALVANSDTEDIERVFEFPHWGRLRSLVCSQSSCKPATPSTNSLERVERLQTSARVKWSQTTYLANEDLSGTADTSGHELYQYIVPRRRRCHRRLIEYLRHPCVLLHAVSCRSSRNRSSPSEFLADNRSMWRGRQRETLWAPWVVH